MSKYPALVFLLTPILSQACDLPPGFPPELVPPECSQIDTSTTASESSLITPEIFDRQWQSGNKSRLVTLQSARLNPYSDKYLKNIFSLELNKTVDQFDIETTEDGDERAEIAGSQLYWYGDNFFFDGGRYGLDYTITDFSAPDGEIEKTISYGRSLLGARFNPILDLVITFGLSMNDKPEVINNQFSSDEDRSFDPFFAISGFGLHYSRDENDDITSDYASYHYEHDQFDLAAYWLALESDLYDVSDEYGMSLHYEWENSSSTLNNTIKLSRNELKNTDSQYWGLDLEYLGFRFHTLKFDKQSEGREKKYGYGLSANITGWLAKEPTTKMLTRDTGISVGVHFNNISEYVLTIADQVVWSMNLTFKYD